MTPKQYLSKMELDRREARRAKKGDVRQGATVECAICGYRGKTLTHHLRTIHDITVDEYKASRCVTRVIADDVGFSAGIDNPAHDHGGKFSAWSEKFVHGYDADRHAAFKKSHSVFQTNNPTNQFSRAHYRDDTEYSYAQKRDLRWFTEKFGDVDGRRRHALKTERWAKSFRSCSYSAISQELFRAIDVPGAYYATKESPGMEKYKNKEFVLSGEFGTFRLDFYDPSSKRATEFDGDYWHSNAKVNPEREKRRTASVERAGVVIHRVQEQDYKKDKQGTIEKCIQFLRQ